MDGSSQIIADAGLGGRSRKSRWPARLDVLQSLSGLAVALFMWGHMFFVSSILINMQTDRIRATQDGCAGNHVN